MCLYACICAYTFRCVCVLCVVFFSVWISKCVFVCIFHGCSCVYISRCMSFAIWVSMIKYFFYLHSHCIGCIAIVMCCCIPPYDSFCKSFVVSKDIFILKCFYFNFLQNICLNIIPLCVCDCVFVCMSFLCLYESINILLFSCICLSLFCFIVSIYLCLYLCVLVSVCFPVPLFEWVYVCVLRTYVSVRVCVYVYC